MESLLKSYADMILQNKMPRASEFKKRWIVACIAKIYCVKETEIWEKSSAEILALEEGSDILSMLVMMFVESMDMSIIQVSG